MELPSTQWPALPGPGGSQKQGGEAVAPIQLILSSSVVLLAHSLLIAATGIPCPCPCSLPTSVTLTMLLDHQRSG